MPNPDFKSTPNMEKVIAWSWVLRHGRELETAVRPLSCHWNITSLQGFQDVGWPQRLET